MAGLETWVLGHFPQLEKLSIDWFGMPRFEGVELDLRILKDKPNLKVLSACRVKNLEHLAAFPKLRTLKLRDSKILDVDTILSLKRLERVNIRDCEMSDEIFDALMNGKWNSVNVSRSA